MPGVSLPIPLEKKEIPLNLPVDEDPAQIAFVSVRQATVAEQEIVAEIISRELREYTYDENEKVVSQKVVSGYNFFELRRLQAYLTLTGSNLDVQDEKDSSKTTPLFRFRHIDGKMRIDMTTEEFRTAWGRLPNNWAKAVSDAVWEVNPQWNPSIRGE